MSKNKVARNGCVNTTLIFALHTMALKTWTATTVVFSFEKEYSFTPWLVLCMVVEPEDVESRLYVISRRPRPDVGGSEGT